MEQGEEDVGEPLPGKPRLAGLGEGEDVAGDHAAMFKNPLAGADVPAGVAVAQQQAGAAVGEAEKPDGERDDEEVEERRKEPAGAAAVAERLNAFQRWRRGGHGQRSPLR